MKISAKRLNGFTLVELTIVIVLIGILMTMGLKMFTSTLENAAYSETKSKQERIKLALVSYLRTNGKLPCPDNSDNTVVASGTAALTCNANAGDGYGVIPWQTLGLPRESVIDGWGNYFTYRVANGTASKNWTSKTVPVSDFTVNEFKTPTDALSIQELDATGTAFTALPTTTKAVVVIVSHGKNGFGAKTTKVAARIPITDAGAGEITNATNTTNVFVLRPVTDAAGAFNGAYDDLVAYMLSQDLLQPLVSEGTLKACVAYCTSAITSACSVPVETCTCSGVGLPGIPGGVAPCSGSCGTCTAQPVSVNCVPSPPIPVGATPLTCL